MKYNNFIEIKGLRVPDVTFCSKAVSDDETRPMMNHMYFMDSMLIATDGRRMHMISFSEGEAEFYGFKDNTYYRFLKATKKYCWLVEIDNTVDPVMVFPDIYRVLPKGDDFVSGKFINSTNRKYLYNEMRNLSELIPKDRSFDIDYLTGLPKGVEFKVKFFENGVAVFENDPVKAVIMTSIVDD